MFISWSVFFLVVLVQSVTGGCRDTNEHSELNLTGPNRVLVWKTPTWQLVANN